MSDLLRLPFVRDRMPPERCFHETGRCFWAVDPTDNIAMDSHLGDALGRDFIRYARSGGAPFVLGWAILDMIKAGRTDDVIIGFASALHFAIAERGRTNG